MQLRKLKKPYRYYPVHMDLRRKTCLVVGGGKVAERKIKRLLDFGAHVTVVSPRLSEGLSRYADRKRIVYIQKKFYPRTLKNKDLVFAATDDGRLNRSIARQAKKRRIWVNVAEPGSASDFILPAIAEGRGLMLTVSSHGVSPKRSKRVKEAIASCL